MNNQQLFETFQNYTCLTNTFGIPDPTMPIRPYIAYSLYNFYGATMAIKDRLLPTVLSL